MKTTLVLNDDLYREAKIVAAQRGVSVASVVEEALRLLLIVSSGEEPEPEPPQLPSWDLGEPLVDITDNRALRQALDADRPVNALR